MQTAAGNPSAAVGPAERARQLGLQSDGSGGYIDPQTGETVAKTVNNELVFYNNNRATGGAISDSSGGAKLTQAAPSWSDPMTGMVMVPPGRPESPEEQGAVPDPTPALAPTGYNDFVNNMKISMYQGQQQTDMANKIHANATANVNNPMQAAPASGINPIGPDGKVHMGPGLGGGLPGVTEDVGDNAALRQKAGVLPLPGKSLADRRSELQKINQQPMGQQAPAQQAPVQQAVAQQAAPEPEAQEEQHPIMNATRQKLLTAIQTMNSGGGRQKAGVGGLKLSPEDLDKMENYIKNGAQNETIDLSDEDFDWAKGQLDESLGGKRSRIKGYISKLDNKGSVAPELRINNRGDRVLRSYLSNLGQSAIDGSPLALSESDLDHHIPLADGGADDIENWRWLPRRFNNFKKDYEDEVLLENIKKQRERDPLDDELRDKQAQLQNEMQSEWRQSYGERGWGHLNKADLMELTGGPGIAKLKALAKAAGISTTTAEGVKPGSRTPNRSKKIDELRDEIIENLGIPDYRDITDLDGAVFKTLQKLEDRRVEVDDINRQKKAKSAAKRKMERDAKMKSMKEEYTSDEIRERVEAFRRFRAKYERM